MSCNCEHCVDFRQPERVKLRAELGLKELTSVEFHRNMQLDEMHAEHEFYRWHPRRVR